MLALCAKEGSRYWRHLALMAVAFVCLAPYAAAQSPEPSEYRPEMLPNCSTPALLYSSSCVSWNNSFPFNLNNSFSLDFDRSAPRFLNTSFEVDASSREWEWPAQQASVEWLDARQNPTTTGTGEPVTPGQQTESEALDRRDRIFYPGDTERPKPLVRKLLLNILFDEKDIFTSPFRMNHDNAKWWLLAGVATAGLIVADRRIANSFENSHGQVVWGGRISQIGAPYTVVPLVAGYYIFGVVADHAKAREIGVLGTESLLDGLIAVGILKELTRRNRPFEAKPGDFWGGGDSFPSGHSVQMWSVASLVAHEYKRQPWVAVVAYSLAAVVSASRMAAQQHFASDVFVGGAMGWAIGRYVYNTHMSHLAHKHASLVPTIVPQYQADSLTGRRSIGVMVLFTSGNSQRGAD